MNKRKTEISESEGEMIMSSMPENLSGVFIAEGAIVRGNVTIGEEAVFFTMPLSARSMQKSVSESGPTSRITVSSMWTKVKLWRSEMV